MAYSHTFEEVKALFEEGSVTKVKERVDPQILKNIELQRKLAEGVTFVHMAAEAGSLEILEFLIKELKLPVNAADSRNGAPILEAACSGNISAISWLIHNGSDINASDDRGDTALHIASGYGHKEAVVWLLDNGSKIDTTTKEGLTPFLYATVKGQLDVMKYLATRGAKTILVEKTKGWSALHIAASANYEHMVHWLLKEYPELAEKRSITGESPLDIAQRSMSLQAYSILLKRETATSKAKRKRTATLKRKLKGKQEAAAVKQAVQEVEMLYEKLFLSESNNVGTSGQAKTKVNANVGNHAQIQGSTCRIKNRKKESDLIISNAILSDGVNAKETALAGINEGIEEFANLSCKSMMKENIPKNEVWSTQVSRKSLRKQRKRDKIKAENSILARNKCDESQGVIWTSYLQNSCDFIKLRTLARRVVCRCNQQNPEIKPAQNISSRKEFQLRPNAPSWTPRRKFWGRQKQTCSNEHMQAFRSYNTHPSCIAAMKRKPQEALIGYTKNVGDRYPQWSFDPKPLLLKLKEANQSNDLEKIKNILNEIMLSKVGEILRFAMIDTSFRIRNSILIATFSSLIEEANLLMKSLSRERSRKSSRKELQKLFLNICTFEDGIDCDITNWMALWKALGIEEVEVRIHIHAVSLIPVIIDAGFDFTDARPGSVSLKRII